MILDRQAVNSRAVLPPSRFPMSPAGPPGTASARGWTHRQGPLVGALAARCSGGDGIGLEPFLPPARTTFFAYGRQALAEALRRAGVVAGDSVLVPSLVCQSVLTSLAALGAVPRFYAVGEDLTTNTRELERAAGDRACGRARAVIAVNYFGFPQELAPFKDWCADRGVPLIEDNAHGLLSCAGTEPLGRRGDFGVLSLRKTLAVPNGAAVIDNRPGPPDSAGRLAYDGSPSAAEWKFRLKDAFKCFIGVAGLPAVRIVAAVRGVRRATARRALADGGAAAEREMPQEGFSSLTARLLHRCDVDAERARRRTLYESWREALAGLPGVRPLFGDLSPGVVPHGYPFLFSGDQAALKTQWWRRGILLRSWPDLPAAVEPAAPVYYRSIMLVSFLW